MNRKSYLNIARFINLLLHKTMKLSRILDIHIFGKYMHHKRGDAFYRKKNYRSL